MNRNSISQAILPIAYIATGLFIGVSLQAHSDSKKTRTLDVVRTHKIEVVDSKERVRMVLDTLNIKDGPDGDAFQAFKTANGNSNLTVGFPGVFISGTEEGAVGLVIRPSDGHALLTQRLKNGGESTYDLSKLKD